MSPINVQTPITAKPDELIIDIAVDLSSELQHLSRLKYTSQGLYDVPLNWKFGLDEHTSYHQSGQMHSKITRGKLMVAPGNEILGIAKPHTDDKGILVWQRQAQPWNSLRGVERVCYQDEGIGCFTSIPTNYPVYDRSDSDYIFKIDAKSLTSIHIAYFLVELGNQQALESRIEEMRGSWPNPRESVAVEKAELFANLNPWLAIVLFSLKTVGSEPLLSGQPGILYGASVFCLGQPFQGSVVGPARF